jgi:hypothetical protein
VIATELKPVRIQTDTLPGKTQFGLHTTDCVAKPNPAPEGAGPWLEAAGTADRLATCWMGGATGSGRKCPAPALRAPHG